MLAVIGGSGLNQLDNFTILEESELPTPYGDSVLIRRGKINQSKNDVLFLPRHGDGHHLPPHRINYRANVWATQKQGASHILAVNAVGGIRDDMGPGTLVIPDQIIDYTYGREHTFFTGDEAGLEHIDFTEPYDQAWREKISQAALSADVPVINGGVYGCSQGPRLETAAEIRKMKRDGCDVIGMTGMPEAALARELNLAYGALNLVVNWGAGLSQEAITMDMIIDQLEKGMGKVTAIIQALVKDYSVEGAE